MRVVAVRVMAMAALVGSDGVRLPKRARTSGHVVPTRSYQSGKFRGSLGGCSVRKWKAVSVLTSATGGWGVRATKRT